MIRSSHTFFRRAALAAIFLALPADAELIEGETFHSTLGIYDLLEDTIYRDCVFEPDSGQRALYILIGDSSPDAPTVAFERCEFRNVRCGPAAGVQLVGPGGAGTRFEECLFDSFSAEAVAVLGVSDGTLLDCEISNTGLETEDPAIAFAVHGDGHPNDGWLIEGCEIRNTGASGIDVGLGTGNPVIRGNRIHDIARLKGHGIYNGGGTGALIEGNRIWAVRNDSARGMGITTRVNAVVRNNVVYDTDRMGINYFNSTDAESGSVCLFENNIVWDAGRAGPEWFAITADFCAAEGGSGAGRPVTEVVIRNNTVASDSIIPLRIRCVDDSETDVFVLNNLLYRENGDPQVPTDYIDWGGTPAPPFDVDQNEANLRFDSTAPPPFEGAGCLFGTILENEYALGGGAEAIGAGTLANGAERDICGVLRSADGYSDVGAFEYRNPVSVAEGGGRSSEEGIERRPPFRVFPRPVRSHASIFREDHFAGTIEVYDIAGRLRRELAPGEATWNGRDGAGRPLPSGIYFFRGSGTGFTLRVVHLSE